MISSAIDVLDSNRGTRHGGGAPVITVKTIGPVDAVEFVGAVPPADTRMRNVVLEHVSPFMEVCGTGRAGTPMPPIVRRPVRIRFLFGRCREGRGVSRVTEIRLLSSTLKRKREAVGHAWVTGSDREPINER
ncbi:hypothetical protein ABZV58_18850 [Nocardia sp. NPDC004654]|uniref:hypothetical protein n=1 Tax=Nocardia sp. NPDC004654 TaxID=3154776 RepID=UPI0033A6A124